MGILHELRRGVVDGNGIARRLMLAVILFSSAITVATTASQLYYDYRSDVDAIRERFHQIRAVQVPELVNSVWAVSDGEVVYQLERLLALPDIVEAVVHDRDWITWRAGARGDHRVLVERLPLIRAHQGTDVEIGVLELAANLDNVYGRLWDKLLLVLSGNAVKTFLVALFMLAAFHWLVTRHLYRLAEYTGTIAFMRPDLPDVRLDRKRSGVSRDALDILQDALNALRRRLGEVHAGVEASEANYRQIFDNAPVGLFRYACTGDLLEVNPALATILGYGSPTAMTDAVRRIGPELFVDPQEWDDCRAALARDDAASGRTVRWRRADGSTIWLILNIRAIRAADGELRHHEGSAEDITPRIAAERKLQQAKEAAEAASAAKSQFLANISHELRTPLNAINGFSEIIAGRLLGPDVSDSYCERARDINAAGVHLLALVDQLLDISRIEAGRLVLWEEDVDVTEVAREGVGLLAEQARAGGLALTFEPPDEAVHVWADRLGVKQIIVNLLSNAVKFTPSGGSVRLDLRQDATGRVILSVADTGIGIPQADLPRVAQPFVQVEDAYTRRYGGSGLGLWLVRRLAEMHGADLEIESTEGEGTTVAVRFPADRTRLPPRRSAANAA